MEKWYEEEYLKRAYDQDKALFDFDESVDNLSQVSERYLIDPNAANPVMSGAPAFGVQGQEC